MPNPTYWINIVSRKEGESAVSAAAYQTGEHIYSRRDRGGQIRRNEGRTRFEGDPPPGARTS